MGRLNKIVICDSGGRRELIEFGDLIKIVEARRAEDRSMSMQEGRQLLRAGGLTFSEVNNGMDSQHL